MWPIRVGVRYTPSGWVIAASLWRVRALSHRSRTSCIPGKLLACSMSKHHFGLVDSKGRFAGLILCLPYGVRRPELVAHLSKISPPAVSQLREPHVGFGVGKVLGPGAASQ